MLLKKITLYHVFPALLAALITFAFTRTREAEAPDLRFSAQAVRQTVHALNFKAYDLTNQVAFATALKKRIPVLMGSSELTSGHLPALAQNFFNRQRPGDRFLSVGHAGFQCMGILSVLAANRVLLKDARLTIILSPGWFEEQYSSGTSLNSFFEFVPPNFMYQLQQDTGLDEHIRQHISAYIAHNFDKISKPNATLRLLGKKQGSVLNTLANAPFSRLDRTELSLLAEKDLYLVSQQLILQTLETLKARPYQFRKPAVNWDSLLLGAAEKFRTISTNNTMAVENSYYDSWLKNKRKKRLVAVDKARNQEFKDLEALVHFLKETGCRPLFVIMPLNTRAHEDLSVLQPTVKEITSLLDQNGFKTFDMFSPNLAHYQDGVLEDIMHPYDLGWYQIDKFISDNYADGN